jgi:hypothetical protein
MKQLPINETALLFTNNDYGHIATKPEVEKQIKLDEKVSYT